MTNAMAPLRGELSAEQTEGCYRQDIPSYRYDERTTG